MANAKFSGAGSRKISTYKKGSKAYVESVYKTYGLVPPQKFLQDSRRISKRDERYSTYFTTRQYNVTISDLSDPYFVKALELYRSIKSGEFMEMKNTKFKDNYIKAAHDAGASPEIVNALESIDAEQFGAMSDILPKIPNRYKQLSLETLKQFTNDIADVLNFVISK